MQSGESVGGWNHGLTTDPYKHPSRQTDRQSEPQCINRFLCRTARREKLPVRPGLFFSSDGLVPATKPLRNRAIQADWLNANSPTLRGRDVIDTRTNSATMSADKVCDDDRRMSDSSRTGAASDIRRTTEWNGGSFAASFGRWKKRDSKWFDDRDFIFIRGTDPINWQMGERKERWVFICRAAVVCIRLLPGCECNGRRALPAGMRQSQAGRADRRMGTVRLKQYCPSRIFIHSTSDETSTGERRRDRGTFTTRQNTVNRVRWSGGWLTDERRSRGNRDSVPPGKPAPFIRSSSGRAAICQRTTNVAVNHRTVKKSMWNRGGGGDHDDSQLFASSAYLNNRSLGTVIIRRLKSHGNFVEQTRRWQIDACLNLNFCS